MNLTCIQFALTFCTRVDSRIAPEVACLEISLLLESRVTLSISVVRV